MRTMYHTFLDTKNASQDEATPSFRVLQLNTQAHWSVDDESPEAFQARTALHKAHISRVMPTVVVLQEVDGPATLPQGIASLPTQLQSELGYDGVHGTKYNEKGDQTWILFQTTDVQLVSYHTFRFSEEDSQFALIAHLNVHGGGLLVVAQHAKAGRTNENEDTRIRHSRALLDHLTSSASFKALIEMGRTLLIGDFNAGPHSYEGKYPDAWYQAIAVESLGPLGFTSAYRAWSAAADGSAGIEPPFTTVKWRKGVLISQCIDYVFFQPTGLNLTGVLALPHSGQIPAGGLPAAEVWGSDHLSLGCAFSLVPSTPP